MSSPDLPEPAHRLRIVEDKLDVIPYIASMLSDDEALEGVEAWLNNQKLAIHMSSRDRGIEADVSVESAAGWLLRLVRYARVALAGDDVSTNRCDLAHALIESGKATDKIVFKGF